MMYIECSHIMYQARLDSKWEEVCEYKNVCIWHNNIMVHDCSLERSITGR